jgi:hypothetical protein
VDPDRDVEPRHAVGELERSLGGADVPAGDEQALDAGETGGLGDGLVVVGEALGVQVAVAVDEPHGWSC